MGNVEKSSKKKKDQEDYLCCARTLGLACRTRSEENVSERIGHSLFGQVVNRALLNHLPLLVNQQHAQVGVATRQTSQHRTWSGEKTIRECMEIEGRIMRRKMGGR